MTSIIKKFLWLITGFGFFGMVPLSREPDIRKNGAHALLVVVPLGLSKGKVISLINLCKKFHATHCDGIPVPNVGLGTFLAGFNLDPNTSSKETFQIMRDGKMYALELTVDGKDLKSLQKKLEKMGCRVDSNEVTTPLLDHLDRKLHNMIRREVEEFLHKHVQEEMEECPMCGEGGYPFNSMGECNNCDFPVEDHFNTSKMIQMRKRGKPIKPIAA